MFASVLADGHRDATNVHAAKQFGDLEFANSTNNVINSVVG